jgi:hypothetical protein
MKDMASAMRGMVLAVTVYLTIVGGARELH